MFSSLIRWQTSLLIVRTPENGEKPKLLQALRPLELRPRLLRLLPLRQLLRQGLQINRAPRLH